jgi:hypothetical protein
MYSADLSPILLSVIRNVLLSTLPFLATFFTQCLSRNVFALSNSSFPPSPISLIIPHTVLSELDNLKTSAKSHVGSAARAANNWILTALQTQKRQMYDVIESRSRRRQNIPERSWVVHVENAAHATALDGMGRSAGNLVSRSVQWQRGILLIETNSSQTPDEEIVRLCVSLNKQAEFDVFFCSDDTNARTRAEIEGLPTFSFKELVRDAHGKEASKEELAQLATDLIEQWQSQIQGLEHTPCPPNLMERMEEVDHPMSSPPPAKEVTKTKSAIDKDPSKRTQHRRHAQKTEPKEKSRNGAITREPIPSTKSYPCKVRQDSQAKQSPVITTNTNTYKHQYPDDRSTSSSMWAA